MKAYRTPIILIAGLVGLLALLFWYASGYEKDKYVWSERYNEDDREPFDLSVIRTVMKERNPEKKFVTIKEHLGKQLREMNPDSASYVLIGGAVFLDSASLEELLSFVDKGNSAFVVARYFPQDLMNRIYDFNCNPVWSEYLVAVDTMARFNFTHPGLKTPQDYHVKFFRRHDHEDYAWNYISDTYFCGDSTSQFIPLGYLQTGKPGPPDTTRINFFKVKYGSGTFYFHSTPVLFTNYFLLKEEGMQYADKVFSHMPDGDIYWDQRSKDYYFPKQQDNFYHGDQDVGDSPLRYLLSQTSLRWALYTALALVFLFTLLRARRRQRPIPLLEPNTNSSLDFVTSVGRLYYMQRNHKALCQQKMKQFLAFIRNRYGIPTGNLDEETLKRISEKADVKKSLLDEIVKQFTWINNTVIEMSDNELIHFHQTLDEFYKTCK